MGREVADQIRTHPGFLADVSYIGGLFEKADREALKAAIEKQDFAQLCEALRVDATWFTTLLKESGVRAEQMFAQDPSLAEALPRQQPKE